MSTTDQNMRRKFLPEMEGPMARWYARQRGSVSQLAAYRQQARELTVGLPAGADVLEVAAGPGYLAVEIARLGLYGVTGLDISATMVEIATETARRAGVGVDFRRGEVAAMAFAPSSFHLIVCQAAFKNFGDPRGALDEMHRVLRPGGTAVIQDMNRVASNAEIAAEVARMRLSLLNQWVTRSTLMMLRRRAYSAVDFTQVATDSAFGGCVVRTDGVILEARLMRAPPTG